MDSKSKKQLVFGRKWQQLLNQRFLNYVCHDPLVNFYEHHAVG